MVRYACAHCGKRFEAEEKEVLECPGCFWSTSVKREEDAAETSKIFSQKTAVKPAVRFQIPALPHLPWKLMAGMAGAVVVVFLAMKIAPPLFRSLGQGLKSEKRQAIEQPAVPSRIAPPAGAALSGEEQNILTRRVQMAADRNPSEEERKILQARASFKTGFSERLPSQAWTLENFEEMVRQQEKFFKVTLPRSYKGKLEGHFKKTYLPAAEAFKIGDLIQARNGWVESLAVPVYAGNIQKHRGVVLTMIKPFINDTLSKIGAINSTLVEKKVREQEQEVATRYQKLLTLIQQKAWGEALSAAGELSGKLAAFSNPQQLAGGPANYPPSVTEVDPDIQATLQGLLQVPPPAVSDLEPLQQDIRVKGRVIESFIAEKLSARQMAYDAALERVGRGEWAEAEKILREIDTPVEMVRDASEKIKILKKLQNQGPDEANRQPAK